MSKTSYQLLDLAIMTLIAAVFEGVCVYVFTKFTTSYFLSVAAVLGMIAIFRWGWTGIFVAPIAGAVGVLIRLMVFGDQSMTMWLSYTAGYVGNAVCLLFFMKGNKPRMQGRIGWMILYYLAGYAAIEVLRSIISVGINGSFSRSFVLYLAFDMANVLAGLVVMVLATRQEHFVVDMNGYLLDLKKEREANIAAARAAKNPKINYEELAESGEINEAALLDGGTLSPEDLATMERNRRLYEGEAPSQFDQEQQALKAYQDSKSHKGGKKE